ncbi:cell division protein SepF [Adlercreutzia murintestinalis]|uniref:cell division protein SepF n=1 Tax=Adlercreutzia murintestinalis TaxID=2941325 RepID=UPI0020411501|nr:cell division protein SepF [Adlercreutzia murintestinalis]
MANVSELFGDLKSKLGIGNRNAQAEYDEYDEYEGYDDYEGDYNDYEDYDDYDDGYTTRGGYGNRNTVTTREAGTTPRLVSYSDVRESSRSTSLSGTGARRSSGGRTLMDSSLPHSMTPEGAAEVSAAASCKHAGGGLDSLFSSTTQSDRASDSGSRLPVIGAASAARVSASLAGPRGLRVIRPTDYAQVAEVAGLLRAGDAVVLVFKQTPANLEKRLLDFSFGVASALDASVDCIANKVFAITVGAALSDSEQTSLRTQGIL